MAMAAVRLAARRLTGQESQVILRSAVESELNRGAYARRFSSPDASAANGPKVSTQHPSVSGGSRVMSADRKKEELVDLLHEIQMNKEIPQARRMKDRWLLQRLTAHVNPRPRNPEWRSYVVEQTINRCLNGTTAFLAFLFMVENWSSLVDLIKQRKGADNNSQGSASCAEQNTGN